MTNIFQEQDHVSLKCGLNDHHVGNKRRKIRVEYQKTKSCAYYYTQFTKTTIKIYNRKSRK